MALVQKVSKSVTDEVLATPPSSSSEHIRISRSTKGTDEEEMMTKNGKDTTTVALRDWGYPTFLTKEEFGVFKQFRDAVSTRNQEFRSTVFPFQDALEDEAYALCRWLRARKFNLDETLKKIEEAVKLSHDPRERKFYLSPDEALGVEESFFNKQVPEMYYSSRARSGQPIFIAKLGAMNPDAFTCVTTLNGFVAYHWHVMMHRFTEVMKDCTKNANGDFKRYECFCIIDLKGVNTALLSKRVLKVTKMQSEIDLLCFPETLDRLVIVNAPSTFSVAWKIIRGWIDTRTASKIDILGRNQTKIFKLLSELVDENNLPSDYGGRGISFDECFRAEVIKSYKNSGDGNNKGMEVQNIETYLMTARPRASQKLILKADEVIKLSIFTRSSTGCSLIIKDSKDQILSCISEGGITIKHKSSSGIDANEAPSRYDLENLGILLQEPDTYSVHLKSHGGRKRKEFFLLVATELRASSCDQLGSTKSS